MDSLTRWTWVTPRFQTAVSDSINLRLIVGCLLTISKVILTYFAPQILNSSPGNILTYVWAQLQTGTVAELAAILHFSHHSGRSSSDFNLRLVKESKICSDVYSSGDVHVAVQTNV